MPERTVPSERPVPLTLSHLVLRTAHLDEAVELTHRLLGMKPVGSSPQGAALSHDGEHHRIALLPWRPRQKTQIRPGQASSTSPTSCGRSPICSATISVSKKLGLEPFLSIHHGGTLSGLLPRPRWGAD